MKHASIPPFRHLALTSTGRGHVRQGLACDDFAGTIRESPRSVLLVVADGAGSASFGRIGARTAGEAVLAKGSRRSKSLTETVERARRALELESAVRGTNLEDFATTLLIARVTLVWHRIRIETAQIGDGIILVDDEGRACAVTRPARGEFANETVFLTTSEYHQCLQTGTRIASWRCGVLLVTDGVMPSLFNWRTGSVATATGELLAWGRNGASRGWVDDVGTALNDTFKSRTLDDLGLAAVIIPVPWAYLNDLRDWFLYRIRSQRGQGQQSAQEERGPRAE